MSVQFLTDATQIHRCSVHFVWQKAYPQKDQKPLQLVDETSFRSRSWALGAQRLPQT
jgi:hypothetical protein